ncbi:FAA hydrolase family protein [Amycolatopsis sp. A1MSW2902]|uniref:fumarylacetoacetate hydrolase family protein n=1 Tax=Amycolatopsis sp. A1MSW2902 TaxID=687413 RepID=UPI00307F6B35
MKLACYDDYRVGIVEDDEIRDVTDSLPAELDLVPYERVNWLLAHWAEVVDRLRATDGPWRPLSSVRLRACSPSPRHIFALPGNYREHLGEIGAMTISGKRTANEMGFFLKAPGSLAGPGDAIELPRGSQRRFDHECELAAVIGATAFDVPAEEAESVVFGYTCAVDATMRIDPEGRQEDRSMRKSFQTFTPVGPYLVTADEVGDPHDLNSRLSVNGEVRQSVHTGQMIVDVWHAIEIISSVVTLQPGDLVLAGTPSGVSPLSPGDKLEIAIDRIGSMTLPVVERARVSPRTF